MILGDSCNFVAPCALESVGAHLGTPFRNISHSRPRQMRKGATLESEKGAFEIHSLASGVTVECVVVFVFDRIVDNK